MRKFFLLFLCCILLCGLAYGYGKTQSTDTKNEILKDSYEGITNLFFPHIYLNNIEGKRLVYQDVEQLILPVFFCAKETNSYKLASEEQQVQFILDNTDESVGQELAKTKETDDANLRELEQQAPNIEPVTEQPMAETSAISDAKTQKKVVINREKLKEFDYLRQNFYQIDSSTTANGNLLNASEFLAKDMKLKENVTGPQILIYHTHLRQNRLLYMFPANVCGK